MNTDHKGYTATLIMLKSCKGVKGLNYPHRPHRMVQLQPWLGLPGLLGNLSSRVGVLWLFGWLRFWVILWDLNLWFVRHNSLDGWHCCKCDCTQYKAGLYISCGCGHMEQNSLKTWCISPPSFNTCRKEPWVRNRSHFYLLAYIYLRKKPMFSPLQGHLLKVIAGIWPYLFSNTVEPPIKDHSYTDHEHLSTALPLHGYSKG